MASAVVQITGNYNNGEDVLSFCRNGIIGDRTAVTGTMSLSGVTTRQIIRQPKSVNQDTSKTYIAKNY